MAKKRTYNSNLIKNTLTYSTQDIADLYGIHKRTVQEWYKKGLSRIDNKLPFLVSGQNLIEFLKNKQNKRKMPCNEDQFLCMKCKRPQKALDNIVEIEVFNKKKGNLIAYCSQCNTKMNKRFGMKNIKKIQNLFQILQIHNKDLLGFELPILNTDMKETR